MNEVSLDAAAKRTARASGDGTVAYSHAFAPTAEAVLQLATPPRAAYLRDRTVKAGYSGAVAV